MNLIYSESVDTPAVDNSTVLSSGDQNTIPTVGETPTENKSFSLKDFLGSIGSAAKQVSQASRDIGTAVGTVQGAAKQSQMDYQNARISAATPTLSSRIMQWWNYSSTNDKIIAGLGAAAVVVAVIQLNKGK